MFVFTIFAAATAAAWASAVRTAFGGSDGAPAASAAAAKIENSRRVERLDVFVSNSI